jgi:pimeloyl-ACP methyl ester carboxylesterase
MAYPIVLVGGFLSSPNDYLAMAHMLAAPPYRRIVYITQIFRGDWLALRDPDFRPALDLLARTVELALKETGAAKIELIGHSAGGRLARSYLSDQPYMGTRYDGQRYVSRIITLGTAHTTNEIWVNGFARWLDNYYPGAFFKHIAYRSVVGRSVQGRRFGSLEEILAYRSYAVSFGEGDQLGDGIVPTAACYLPGADNLILDGARHAPYNAPRTWYGAHDVLPAWYD